MKSFNRPPSSKFSTGPFLKPPQTKRQIGTIYEDEASRFLSARGLKLVARNVNFRVGEIDLVFVQNQTLVFVEVRYRSRERSRESALESLDLGGAAEEVVHPKNVRLRLLLCQR